MILTPFTLLVDLYPLLHYVLMDIDFDGAAENRDWFDYVALSKKFAETIAEHANEGDLVWLHDYRGLK